MNLKHNLRLYLSVWAFSAMTASQLWQWRSSIIAGSIFAKQQQVEYRAARNSGRQTIVELPVRTEVYTHTHTHTLCGRGWDIEGLVAQICWDLSNLVVLESNLVQSCSFYCMALKSLFEVVSKSFVFVFSLVRWDPNVLKWLVFVFASLSAR